MKTVEIYNFWAPGALVLILRKQREYRELIVIGGCLVVQVGVTAVAQRNEVTRRLVEHAHIGQMVHLRRAPARSSGTDSLRA